MGIIILLLIILLLYAIKLINGKLLKYRSDGYCIIIINYSQIDRNNVSLIKKWYIDERFSSDGNGVWTKRFKSYNEFLTIKKRCEFNANRIGYNYLSGTFRDIKTFNSKKNENNT